MNKLLKSIISFKILNYFIWCLILSFYLIIHKLIWINLILFLQNSKLKNPSKKVTGKKILNQVFIP